MAHTTQAHKQLYNQFIQLLNEQRLDDLSEVVNPQRYHEQCIGYAPGWMNLEEAKQNLRKVYRGIPDLHARVETLVAEGDSVTARLTLTGTHLGPLFGVPATGRFYQVNGFDAVDIADGKIVRRIQQADLAGQVEQLFAPWLKAASVLVGAGVLGLGVALVSVRRR